MFVVFCFNLHTACGTISLTDATLIKQAWAFTSAEYRISDKNTNVSHRLGLRLGFQVGGASFSRGSKTGVWGNSAGLKRLHVIPLASFSDLWSHTRAHAGSLDIPIEKSLSHPNPIYLWQLSCFRGIVEIRALQDKGVVVGSHILAAHGYEPVDNTVITASPARTISVNSSLTA